MPEQEIFRKFYRVPADSKWVTDRNRYSEHRSRQDSAVRSLMCCLGYETQEFEVYENDIAIWPTENDRRLYGRFLRKFPMGEGQYLIAHRAHLYKEWKKRRAELGIAYLPSPRLEDYFRPAVGLVCSLTMMDSGTYLHAQARSPIETDHFTEIKGSEFYAALHNLHLLIEARQGGQQRMEAM